MLIATLTLLVAGLVAAKRPWRYPVTHGAIALTVVVACFGVGVFALPGRGPAGDGAGPGPPAHRGRATVRRKRVPDPVG